MKQVFFGRKQLEWIDDDKIIVVMGDCDLKMISVSEKKIIMKLKLD